MSPTPYFAPPFGGGNHEATAKSSHPRKRKRDRPRSTEDENEDDPSDEGHDIPLLQGPLLTAQLTELEKAESTIPKHFPHQGTGPSLRANRNRALPDAFMQQDEGLGADDTTFKDPEHSRRLRQQHLSVLTTILHRCLLENDYTRAGRAWGMLLRTECGGRAFDLRANGRWGIGAEILLRQKYHNAEAHLNTRDEEDSELGLDSAAAELRRDRAPEPDKQWFSREGFEKAREYYERLILDYPYYRNAAHRTSALDFYPAMFSLWIYGIQEDHKQEHKTLQDTTSLDSFSVDPHPRTGVLAQASELADRMDALMISPPYSDNSTLLNLRLMVRRWIEDLQVEKSPIS